MNILESLGCLFLSLIAIVVVVSFNVRLPRRLEGFIVIAPFIALFLLVSSIWNSVSAFIYPSTPTSRPFPTFTQRPRSTPIKLLVPTRNPCRHWDEITSAMDGQQLCVYGTVVDYRENWDNELSYLYFGTNDQFFFVSNYRWTDPLEGECVMGKGIIQLNTYKVPYIKIDKVYSCEP